MTTNDAQQQYPLKIDTRYWVDIGDTHVGSKYGLYPGRGFVADGGGLMLPNKIQQPIREAWDEFWGIVYDVVGPDDFLLTHKGDVVEGNHHHTKEAMTTNYNDQQVNAVALLKEHCTASSMAVFTRGTPAHAGQASEIEEQVAKECGAVPDSLGRFCWPMAKIYWNDLLLNVAHHIGTTAVSASSSTALRSEQTELQRTASRVGTRPPDIVSRGHRHHGGGTFEGNNRGMAWSVTTPGWQGRGDFPMKTKGGRVSEIEVGGILWDFDPRWGATPHLIHWFIIEHDGEPRRVRR